VRPGMRKPREDNIGQGNVFGIRFKLINQDAAIQRNPLVALEDGAEAIYSQLSRSLWR